MKIEDFLSGSLVFLGLAGFIIIAVFLGGFMFMCLWNWFITPVFGIISLNLIQATGITIVLALTVRNANTNKDKDEEWWGSLGATVILFLIGYLLHFWI